MTAPSHMLVQAEPDLSARTLGRLALSHFACLHGMAGACSELCSIIRPLLQRCRDGPLYKHCPMRMEGLTVMVALKTSWQEALMGQRLPDAHAVSVMPERICSRIKSELLQAVESETCSR